MPSTASVSIRMVGDATAVARMADQVSRHLQRIEKQYESTAQRMSRVGRDLSTYLSLPVGLALSAVGKSFVDWQDQFAGVEKTVDAGHQVLAVLNRDLRSMSEELPLSQRELALIAETAGQLGIKVHNITRFTRVAAMMGTATNMAAQDAAVGMARFANVMRIPQTEFDRMGSSIVYLGNNLATTESEILEMAQRIAGAGVNVGLSAGQVFGIAGALSSVGIEAQAGGSSISRTMIKIAAEVSRGGRQLEMFARVAGMSSAEFRRAWQQDAGSALASFVSGLERVRLAGGDVFGVLERLEITEIRERDALLRASAAADLFSESMAMGVRAWEENSALVTEAEKKYKKFAAQLTMLRNQLRNALIIFGEGFSPVIAWLIAGGRRLIGVLQQLARGFAALPAPVRFAVGALLLFLAVLGPAVWTTAQLTKVVSLTTGVLAGLTRWLGSVTLYLAGAVHGAWSMREALEAVGLTAVRLRRIAIAGLVAGAIWMALNWDRAKDVVVAAWHAISAVALYGSSLIVRGIGFILMALSAIIPSVRPAAEAVWGLADSLKRAAMTAAGLAKASARGKALTATAAAAEGASQAASDAAGAETDLANALGDAAEAAGRNLQSFDEVHSLQEEMAAADLAMPAMDLPMPEGVPELPDVGAEVPAVGDPSIIERLQTAWSGLLASVTEGLARLRDQFPWLNALVQMFADAAGWVRANWDTVGPVLEGLAGVLLLVGAAWLIATHPVYAFLAIAALVATAAAWIIANWETVGPWFETLWEGIKSFAIPIWDSLREALATIWAGIVETAVFLWDGLKAFWERWGQTITAIAQGAWRQVVLTVQTAINLVKDIVGLVLALIRGDWSSAWDHVKGIARTVWGFIVGTWKNIKQTTAEVWAAVAQVISGWWDSVKRKTVEMWLGVISWIADRWEGVKSLAADIWAAIAGIIGDAWQGVKDTTRMIWRGIANAVIGFVNGIIRAINGMIRALNSVKFSVPSWVPFLGGKSFGFDLKQLNQIPYLAGGGTITGAGLAVVGEAGPELLRLPQGAQVSPLSGGSDIADTVAQAVYAAIRDAFQVERARGGSSDRELVLQIDGQRIARVLVPAIRREEQRTGIRTLRPQEV